MKKKLSKGGKIAIFIIGIIVLLFVVASIVSTPTDGGSDSTSSAAEGAEQQSLEGKVLYEDSNYKVTYVGFEDPGMGVTAFNLSLKIENNSDKKVVATLVDGYANDTAVFFGSAVPVEIMPGKNAFGVFILGYNNTGISSIDEIEKLQFKIQLYDENFSESLLKTSDIMLNLK
jgi:hypothetical protein